MIRIKLTNVFVDDQAKALAFYTDVLGFERKSDMPEGDFRGLTVVSPADRGGVELLLEPNDNPVAQAYQKGLFESGLPAAVFEVDDVHAAIARLTARGVTFRTEPSAMGPVTIADLEDTCGNVVQIAQG